MAYRSNPTDKQQSEIELAANDGGVPVLMNAKTRVIGKALNTAPLMTNHGSAVGGQRNNAGVVIPPSDRPGKFETPGKA